MITRMWEARAADADALAEAMLAGLPTGADGYAGGDVYRSLDQPGLVVVITNWRDEAALAAYAGEGWRTRADDAPVPLVEGEAHVWHFAPIGPR